MLKLFLKHPVAAFFAIVIHVAFVVLVGASFYFSDEPVNVAPKVDVVQATVVDEAKVQKELKKIKAAERMRQTKIKKAKAARIKEEKRLAKLKKARIREEKKQKERKKAEKKRLQEVKKKRKQEEERLRNADQKRREQALREKMAVEQQRINSEKNAARQSTIGKYKGYIKTEIERHWKVPASAKIGMVCEIRVRLIPGGEVIDAQVSKSSGSQVFDQSVISAVKRASPLTVPPADSGLFEEFRDLILAIDLKKKT